MLRIYIAIIAVVSCSNCHALLGKWTYAYIPQLLLGAQEPSVELETSWVACHDANHCTTESTTLCTKYSTQRRVLSCWPSTE